MTHFKIVVPSFNSVDYLPKTLASIEMQTYKDYTVGVIDDGSTIPKQREIILEFCNRNGWSHFFHDQNYGALYGMVHAIPKMGCKDEDVIVILDGDDWLAHEKVLNKLDEVYSSGNVQITWGQNEIFPMRGTMAMHYAQPIPDLVVEQRLYRQIPFVFWHLSTFKYLLWRHIKDEDLRDEDGSYFRIMKDKATIYPMLELAGTKIRFIDEVLCIYNVDNPLNDFDNTIPEEHERVDRLIRGKPKYPIL